MIEIDGVIILSSVEQILEDLRVEMQLNNIPLLKDIKYNEQTKNIMITCPHHKDGQESSPSCGVSKTDIVRNGKTYKAGTVNCFTCGYKADLPEFVSRCFGTTDRNYGKRYIIKKYNTMELAQRPDVNLNFSRDAKSKLPYKYIEETELDKYRFTSDYMYYRGFNDTTIEFYEYGLDQYNNAITLPVRDHKGGLVFVKKRYISPAPGQDKYMNATGVPKQYIMYGFYQMLKLIEAINNGTCANKKLEENYKRYGLILTEGEFNSSYLVQNGYPAVSLLGRILFENQSKHHVVMQKELLLRYGIRKITPWMDYDEPGREAQEKITKQLWGKFILQQPDFTQFTYLNEDYDECYYNDANEYTPEMLDNLKFLNIA